MRVFGCSPNGELGAGAPMGEVADVQGYLFLEKSFHILVKRRVCSVLVEVAAGAKVKVRAVDAHGESLLITLRFSCIKMFGTVYKPRSC